MLGAMRQPFSVRFKIIVTQPFRAARAAVGSLKACATRGRASFRNPLLGLPGGRGQAEGLRYGRPPLDLER
jgi:hypothetical protein